MSTRRVLRVTGEAALQLLKLTHASADVLPPLKSVAGGALYITELVMKFRTSKEEWRDFGTYVQDIVATIINSLGIVDPRQTETINKMKELELKLGEITETIEAKQREGFGLRLLHFLGHPDMIAELRKKVDDAVGIFKFDLAMRTEIKVDKTLKVAKDNNRLLFKVARNATLSKLRHVEDASWDPDRACLEHTRRHVIDGILSWVDSADESRSTNIFLLTGVAGAGKSTIAHTVAQHYYATNQLVTSFFFDRETNDRNNPKHLSSTIAIDLCQTNKHLAKHITRVIEEDGRIVYARMSRQFEELVLKPCERFAAKHPLVIILDALDEGYDKHLLTILTQRVSQLPHGICFIVTARTLPDLDVLCQQPHVHKVELDIHAPESIEDIALFASHRLKKVAEYHRLGDHWPDPELVDLFTFKAGGLFIWVATVCDYLLTRSNPTNELLKLVSMSHTTNVSAESKMDKLYSTILETCDWDDDDFVGDYCRLMGAVVASKTPLTLGALASLYQLTPLISNLTRGQLSPLLTGLGNDTATLKPVRFLHQSLPDFLTQRALRTSSSVDNRKFAIDERAHSQTLATKCLGQMNQELNGSIPGIGYLTGGASMPPGIPSPSCEISEALWYACRFWLKHLLDIDLPWSPTLSKQLGEFLETRLTLWMELITTYGQYEGLSKLQNHVKKKALEEYSMISLVFNKSQGDALRSLAKRLDYMGRLEEALTAAREGVEVYRKLMEDAPSESRKGLSRALNILSTQLWKLGYHEDALKASEEEVQLARQLAKEQPAVFTSDLASSVHNLSVRFTSFGRHEEALKASEEAVKLRRQLASERPAAFTSDLANSVHSLSIRLASFGRHEEALEAIEEAVKLFRQLASERPAAFTSHLAYSVHQLSICLASMGCHKEGLEAIEEAVELWRQLASERPAAFTSDLANSVHCLSSCLARMGRHEEALEAIEEAVKLRRQLASERPAAFTSDLASSVHELADRLYNLGRHEEALKASEEAVELGRQLASERPAAFTPELANSLYNLAIDYNHRGWHQKALAAIKESAELYHPFAEKYPARYGTNYSNALRLLEEYSANAGTDKEAPAASAEPNAAASAE